MIFGKISFEGTLTLYSAPVSTFYMSVVDDIPCLVYTDLIDTYIYKFNGASFDLYKTIAGSYSGRFLEFGTKEYIVDQFNLVEIDGTTPTLIPFPDTTSGYPRSYNIFNKKLYFLTTNYPLTPSATVIYEYSDGEFNAIVTGTVSYNEGELYMLTNDTGGLWTGERLEDKIVSGKTDGTETIYNLELPTPAALHYYSINSVLYSGSHLWIAYSDNMLT
jgi:hypothetical protein